MAMTNSQIERKLAQHDNDIHELYTMLAEVRERVEPIPQMQADIAELKTDVAGLKTDMAGVKDDMETLKGGLAEVLRRLPEAS